MNLFPVNSYYKKILRVALPAIAGLSSQMVVSLVDSAMVGRLDEATYALAAMGIPRAVFASGAPLDRSRTSRRLHKETWAHQFAIASTSGSVAALCTPSDR